MSDIEATELASGLEVRKALAQAVREELVVDSHLEVVQTSAVDLEVSS